MWGPYRQSIPNGSLRSTLRDQLIVTSLIATLHTILLAIFIAGAVTSPNAATVLAALLTATSFAVELQKGARTWSARRRALRARQQRGLRQDV
jgi:hypothetical protein